MAAIYKNAHVVIAADISTDCNSGFLPRQSRAEDALERILAKVTDSNNGTRCVIYGRKLREHKDALRSRVSETIGFVEDELYWEGEMIHRKDVTRGFTRPLAERAWTLQEEVIASRTIHFAHDKMYWV